MTAEQTDPLESSTKTAGSDATATSPVDEVQELVWALVDEQLDETQFARLEQLLSESEAARKMYVECMQLHAGLIEHFRQADPTVPETLAPLLGDLHTSILTTPPPVDSAGA